jgi:sporulation protein YlmC with PRC-barrel domain
MSKLSWHALLAAAALAVVVMGNRAIAVDDEPSEADTPKATAGAIEVPTTFRSSKLMGMSVRNPEGDDLGKIEDLVIDIESGQVRYAALSFGGFLGVGDKLFAVPMKAMKFAPSDDDSHFVLDVDKQRLENAPGFSPEAWPKDADPQWAEVDAFYGSDATSESAEGSDSHTGIVVSAANGKLTMTDEAGENQHSHRIGRDVTISLDGDEAELKDLKKGYDVTVTTGERDGKQVVVSIEARSPKP